MACYHPLKAIDFGKGENGKHIIKVLKGEYNPYEKCTDYNAEFIPLPCGRCIGCRLDYSRQWADRCMAESLYHENNWFLTLTYKDECLPPCKEGSTIHSLDKKQLQDFIKNLRRKIFDDYCYSHPIASLYYSKKKGSSWRSKFKEDYPYEYDEFIANIPKIRYFACGEYGSELRSNRPHYHLLLFGLKLDDLVIHKRDIKNGFIYYISDYIGSLWPFGYHYIAKLCWNTCAYTSRYIVKKQKGINALVYEEKNYEPEFVIMSRRKGIGYQFAIEHPEVAVKSFFIGSEDGSRKITTNKYFDTIFDSMDCDRMNEIKEVRKRKSLDNLALKLENTSLKYSDLLKCEEYSKEQAIKSLKRKEC